MRTAGSQSYFGDCFSFSALADGGESTLAYLVAVANSCSLLQHVTANDVYNFFVSKYELDEQATTIEELAGADENISKWITPISPILLAKQWSPLSFLMSVADPGFLYLDKGLGLSIASWKLCNICPATETFPTHASAVFLKTILERTKVRARGYNYLIIMAMPGWSYSSAEENDTIGDNMKIMMGDLGYVALSRIQKYDR